MRPQDEAIVNNLGPQGIANGRKALNAASNLARNVFPGSGPIINRDGAIQTKWGQYALNNPQDADIINKLLDVTRALMAKIPNVE